MEWTVASRLFGIKTGRLAWVEEMSPFDKN